MRLRAVVAYDGTDFRGFQRQADDRTVQGVLEAGFAALYGRPVAVRGAGRTDAGVHARGQVIAADVPDVIPAERVALAVRAHLPGDVSVRASRVAADRFDPRREAVWRRYRYSLVEDWYSDPTRDRFCLRVDPGLDREAAATAVGLLRGCHEFRSLCCESETNGPTTRSLRRAELVLLGPRLELVLEAESFLYKQVRCTVGMLLAVGRRRLDLGAVGRLLEGAPRPPALSVAPPVGLVLERVAYPADEDTEEA